MNSKIIFRTAIMSLALGGCAGRPGTATTYGPARLLGGYSEKQVEPGIWKVTGNSNDIAERGFGQAMAAYRAAELAKAAGFTHFQIVDQKGSTRMIGVGRPDRFAGESMTLTIRGTNDANAPIDCRARQADRCFVLAVDAVMARYGPKLTFRNQKTASR